MNDALRFKVWNRFARGFNPTVFVLYGCGVIVILDRS